MGYLYEGRWLSDEEYSQLLASGVKPQPSPPFKQVITADGSSGFPAVPGRYQLFLAWACPWAHRAFVTRTLLKLQDTIEVQIVSWGVEGWKVEGSDRTLRELYVLSKADFTGWTPIPVLWDTVSRQIISNDSGDIILMLNEAFGRTEVPDLYPAELRSEIDSIDADIMATVNTGPIRVHGAKTQEEYDENVDKLFAQLDRLEERLQNQRFLVGNCLTLADVRLFTSLVRFDPIYFILFRCCTKPLAAYHNLSNYVRDIAQLPGVSETINQPIMRAHYYRDHNQDSPTKIVPKGPVLDVVSPHDRSRFPMELVGRNRAALGKGVWVIRALEGLIPLL